MLDSEVDFCFFFFFFFHPASILQQTTYNSFTFSLCSFVWDNFYTFLQERACGYRLIIENTTPTCHSTGSIKHKTTFADTIRDNMIPIIYFAKQQGVPKEVAIMHKSLQFCINLCNYAQASGVKNLSKVKINTSETEQQDSQITKWLDSWINACLVYISIFYSQVSR